MTYIDIILRILEQCRGWWLHQPRGEEALPIVIERVASNREGMTAVYTLSFMVYGSIAEFDLEINSIDTVENLIKRLAIELPQGIISRNSQTRLSLNGHLLASGTKISADLFTEGDVLEVRQEGEQVIVPPPY